RRRQMKLSWIVESYRVLEHEPSLWYIAKVRPIGCERAFLIGGPHRTALDLALRQERRVAAEPTTERRAAGWNRIVDDHPCHVRLGLHFEVHARDIATTPFALDLLLHRGHLARNPVTGRHRLSQRDRRNALQRDPWLAAAIVRQCEIGALR